MSILIYTESEEGKLKKTAFEVASYAKDLARQTGSTVTAVSINAGDTAPLGNYGVDKVLRVNDDRLAAFNARAYADIIQQAARQEAAKIVIIGSTANDKYLAPLLAAQLEAGYAPNVVALPESTDPFRVKRTAFSNKAFNITEISTDIKLVGLAKNSFGLKEQQGNAAEEDFSPSLNDADFSITTESVDKTAGKVTIADAEIVVSGGRGLKGPENWGMIEDLAGVLGAATACSKPVSDMGWRPHGEHVGQTGKPVAANLYVAVGISGAIQHLAGINASKVKVVINNDPEAPFFKAADYGVVGDAFEVVPALTEKLKEFKSQNS
ncbi:electron transfer flavoprotein subunit alpha/FixB family protein [Sinomicrobium soli]|uniref:electron transfer flavoprotein subunit alpha/FixB family protein n=1 Tax=Sinomicrobium sp. N-1-3-6 TaxID=2219864 RepID=UPI000DCE4404|nr:electron transfer flavoprotein subunit alpha/FixB family protein [Sinomicrobium sp. N-1-3-6]RAV29724.1 electron transfer flavoprotein subunit alpha/FixB family protein [Sinomicrobium sp. N-1-3-6]